MKSNRFRVRVSLLFLLVCVAAGLVTLRLAGQLPVGQVAVIHVFTGGADGANPATGLIQMPNGNFAGMTKGQGSQSAQPPTVYTMTPGGQVTTLYTFAKDGSQGWSPLGLMQASDGNFYGTADTGGIGHVYSIFRVTTTGQFTLVYTFPAGDQIGGPLSGFVEAADGNLYARGGLGVNGAGCIFRVNLRRQTTSLFYSFVPFSGPYQPNGGLGLGPDGRIYGVTSAYSAPDGTFFPGCVYAIDTNAKLTVLAVNNNLTQTGGADDKPAFGTDGYLYFASYAGGSGGACPDGCGTIFRVAMSGSDPELLYSFTGGSDHQGPVSIVLGSDGMFYGTYSSFSTGPSLFQFNPVTKTVVAFDFPTGAGREVLPYPLQSASGVLRGTTQQGAATKGGTSYALNLTLPAPRPMITGFAPTSGPPGTVVTVWGSNFVGLKSVALNGLAAEGQAKAAGFIRFVVPASATTGPITVTTVAGGGVSSAVDFTVQ